MTHRQRAMLRRIAFFAILLVITLGVCAGLSYVLAWQSDEELEAQHRNALSGAIAALQPVTPDLTKANPKFIQALERSSGLKGLYFETEPSVGDRAVQSVLGPNGRIVGWLNWQPVRPATEIVQRLLPLAGLIAAGLVGFAAFAMWQLRSLGLALARSEQRIERLDHEDILTSLPNHSRFFQEFDETLAARKRDETLAFFTVDLDGFGDVNDSFGHASGDEVLVEIGRRLREMAPSGAVIGSGDSAVTSLRC